MGIWLALLPLIVVRRKKKQRGFPWAGNLLLLVIVCVGGLVACNDNGNADHLIKEMNEFADEYGIRVCTDELVNTGPHKYQDETNECILDGEPMIIIAENAASPDRGLFQDIYIVFCLGEGVNAKEDCWVGSRVQGYQRKRLAGETEWDYSHGNIKDWGYVPDLRLDDPSGGAGGIDYNGTSPNFEYPPGCPSCTYQRIVFRDTPGFHAVDEDGEYTVPLVSGTREVSYQFWTMIYDKQDYMNFSNSEDPFAIQPVYVMPWCFKAELTVP